MDVESLLKKLSESPDLKPFRGLIEPLLAHDRGRRSDLVRTLRIYLATGANASETADRLFLHRNSVLYRLTRIQKLLGLDLREPEARLVLRLGLLVIDAEERSFDDEAEHP